MEVIKAAKEWEKAQNYYVRIKTMVLGENVPFEGEFDDDPQLGPDYYVIRDGSEPVGTCRVHKISDTIAKIERVVVVPERQHQGIGKELILKTEDILRTEGINRVVINSRDSALGFYKGIGYEEADERVIEKYYPELVEKKPQEEKKPEPPQGAACCLIGARRPEPGEAEKEEEKTAFTGFKCILTDKIIDVFDIDAPETEDSKKAWEWIYDNLYDPIFKAGSAKSQEAYEEQYDLTFKAIYEIEEKLKSSKYIAGDAVTKADVELYSILVRLDTVYFYAFKLNKRKLCDLPNIWRYAKELYAKEEFRAVTDFEALKKDFYLSQSKVRNPYGLVPLGPDVSIWLS